MARSPERARGDVWAAALRRAGCWVQKMPGSSLAGVPDWLVGRGGHIWWVEAKMALKGPTAYRPTQLSRAQRYHLDQVAAHGGRASVLILGRDRYLELLWVSAQEPLPQHVFELLGVCYE